MQLAKFSKRRAVIGGAIGMGVGVAMIPMQMAANVASFFTAWASMPFIFGVSGALVAHDTSLVPEKKTSEGLYPDLPTAHEALRRKKEADQQDANLDNVLRNACERPPL